MVQTTGLVLCSILAHEPPCHRSRSPGGCSSTPRIACTIRRCPTPRIRPRSGSATTRIGTDTTTSLDVSVTGADRRAHRLRDRPRRAQSASSSARSSTRSTISNFNLEVDFMRGIIPTTENIIVAMWRVLEPAIAPARLTPARALGDAEQLRRVRRRMSALHGRSALVTGASRGIGLDVARALAADGMRVDHGRAVRRRAAGARRGDSVAEALPMPCDVADARAVTSSRRRRRERIRRGARRDRQQRRGLQARDRRSTRARGVPRRARRQPRRALPARARVPRRRCARAEADTS